ncbi:Fur family transcriptional regulator [Botrimarina hoheduenensis]|uniref:Ferric uptake regulation protein n=1 Tax=Botrimarina hoheduenensis TaxID=2528000 RepID=A0A5C5VXR4_9BACT|nr:Fur family transcriptional regulator [Botrimarina hoheduenensis]TWT43240.1 Ferric uptake regulation protein [Botrimarina hoheduenensis]
MISPSSTAKSSSAKHPLGQVRVSMTPQQRFEEYLQSKGKRTTQQRRVLIDHVFASHSHFDADELIDQLDAKATESRSSAARVSRATVYRALDELVEAGLLRKMTLGGRSVYEHDYGYPQHDHLHCEACNQLVEFRSEAMDALCEEVASENGFRLTGGRRLILTGICPDCAAKRHRRRSPLDLI